MQVKSIAECYKGSILQYFRPSLSYNLSLRSFEWLFYTGFTVQSYVWDMERESFTTLAIWIDFMKLEVPN